MWKPDLTSLEWAKKLKVEGMSHAERKKKALCYAYSHSLVEAEIDAAVSILATIQEADVNPTYRADGGEMKRMREKIHRLRSTLDYLHRGMCAIALSLAFDKPGVAHFFTFSIRGTADGYRFTVLEWNKTPELARSGKAVRIKLSRGTETTVF